MEDLCFGGTQKQNLELARRLDRELFSPQILTLTGVTDLDDIARNAGITPFYLGTSRKVPPLFFMKTGRALRRLQPDIMVCCTALPNIWGRIWGTMLNIPIIVGTCRGGGAPSRQHERFLWRMSNHIVCNSRELVSKMRGLGVPEKHLTCINNGVDTDLFKPAVDRKNASPIILCVARLAKDKDHETLLRAFAIVAQKHSTVRLRLLGDGPEEQHLKKFAATMLAPPILERVDFAGASGETAPHYAEASIFALSSIREGQPNAILEAMSSGLPVCATSVGGIPELVEEGQTGFLSPSGDAWAIAMNFEKLLANEELAKNMGHNGRSFIEKHFSFRNMVNAHQKLFEQLWSKLPPSRDN